MIIWLHAVAALLALGLGAANCILAKGTPLHRIRGWVWITVMLCVSFSSFAIRELNEGAWSWIHALTLWTIFCLVAAIVAVRGGRVGAHSGFMVGTMIGVVVAGVFALTPGRFLSGVLGN